MDPGRYWSVMVLDAYTHVAYVCRRLHGCDGAYVRVTHRSRHASRRRRRVRRDPGGHPDGLGARPCRGRRPRRPRPRRRRALARIQVRQPPAPSPPRPGRAGCGRVRAGAAGFLPVARGRAAVDPPAPWHPPPPPGVAALLADLPEADVLAAAAAEGEARIAAGTGADRRGNGWATRSRGADFGDDVAYRASFAKVSLAGHLPAENRSYSRAADGVDDHHAAVPSRGRAAGAGDSGRSPCTAATCSSSRTSSTATASAIARPGCGGTPTARCPSRSATSVRTTPATGCPHRPARATSPCGPTKATPRWSTPAGSRPT